MENENDKIGWIEVICGPMFAGKTEELIRRVKRMELAKQKYLIFKPEIDERYSLIKIISHDETIINAQSIKDALDIENYITADLDAVVIDEIQFFNAEIVEVCKRLADKGLRVICDGLDCDFRGNPFPVVADLLAIAEKVTKLSAICVVCGKEATKTQRLINGKPANIDDPTILVEDKESYEPRCRKCYQIVS